jgi:hypothetical protein
MATKHIADHEALHIAINSTPDMCLVEGEVVPFEIMRTLDNEESAYATKVFARGEKVLLADSIIKGVVGNLGKGVKSTVAMLKGDVKIMDGSPMVYGQGRKVARHLDPVKMNGKA